MNKYISSIFAAALTFSAFSAYTATTPENADDASSIGTSESPQHKQQDMRTDKGPTGMNTDSMKDDSSNLGNSNSPQHTEQNKHIDNGMNQNTTKRHHTKKNKVMKAKELNSGTTKGNQIQPSEPEGAAPATK